MNTYYVAGIPYSDELYHHGIKGQKWGIRRYQNLDGTLTDAGKARYGNDPEKRGSKKLERQLIRSMYNNQNKNNLIKLEKQDRKNEKEFKKLDNYNDIKKGNRGKFADEMVRKYAKALLKDVGYEVSDNAIEFLAKQPWFTTPYSWASSSYGNKNYRSKFAKMVTFN